MTHIMTAYRPIACVLTVLLTMVLTTLLYACGGSPTAPSRSKEAAAVEELLRTTLGLSCTQELDGIQCHAYTVISGSIQRDVTGLATWSTSDPSIAVVNTVGFVTVLAKGEVAIRASYQGAEGFTVWQVEPGGLRRYYRALSGYVRDARDEAKLAGVTVRIIDGPNAGRTATTGADGTYQLYDLEVGTFRLQFSKAGYITVDRTFTLTGTQFNSVDVFLNRTS